MAVKTKARSRKSMYKTGIMICVATVFFTFNTFIKALPRSNPSKILNASKLQMPFDTNMHYDSGRKILWSDKPWIYNEFDENAEVREEYMSDILIQSN